VESIFIAQGDGVSHRDGQKGFKKRYRPILGLYLKISYENERTDRIKASNSQHENRNDDPMLKTAFFRSKQSTLPALLPVQSRDGSFSERIRVTLF